MLKRRAFQTHAHPVRFPADAVFIGQERGGALVGEIIPLRAEHDTDRAAGIEISGILQPKLATLGDFVEAQGQFVPVLQRSALKAADPGAAIGGEAVKHGGQIASAFDAEIGRTAIRHRIDGEPVPALQRDALVGRQGDALPRLDDDPGAGADQRHADAFRQYFKHRPDQPELDGGHPAVIADQRIADPERHGIERAGHAPVLEGRSAEILQGRRETGLDHPEPAHAPSPGAISCTTGRYCPASTSFRSASYSASDTGWK